MIIGCGSIGTRHAQNLKKLGLKNIILCDSNIERAKSLGDKINSKFFYSSYKDAVRENLDITAAIIATPTIFHMDSSIYLAQHNVHLFIEKPLSDSLIKTKEFSTAVKKSKIIVMMGHSYLFEKGFKQLKSLLSKRIIGDLYFVNYMQGQYLPDWHPSEDYRKEYTARKDLGGGALLTLTSHTFYVLEWLFGKIDSIHGNVIQNTKSLDVNVDDSISMLLKTNSGIIIQTLNNFIVRVHNHIIYVEGSKGRIEYNFVSQKITLLKHKSKSKIFDVSDDNNSRFVNEIKYFIKSIKKNSIDENFDLDSGLRFMKLASKVSSNKINLPL
jgi:predicted dehydrogenase|tara:strand:- start:1785 stop:2765 length:981 start_codon:yes stop_codon:yes gene_type:complete